MNKNYRRLLSSDSLQKTKVINGSNEDLGKIEELMINIENGKVEYAVLSFGGFLGMGDKFYAIPWDVLHIDENEEVCILDIPKDRLESAPGFDKHNWPDFADESLVSNIRRHYEDPSRKSDMRRVI